MPQDDLSTVVPSSYVTSRSTAACSKLVARILGSRSFDFYAMPEPAPLVAAFLLLPVPYILLVALFVHCVLTIHHSTTSRVTFEAA